MENTRSEFCPVSSLIHHLFMLFSACKQRKIHNEPFSTHRNRLKCILSIHTHEHRQSGSIESNAHAHFPVFCACCSFQLCFALLFSPIMFNHFRAALFILSIFHSFATSALLSFYFFPISPIVVDLCFWFFLLLCFNNFVENWIIEVNY